MIDADTASNVADEYLEIRPPSETPRFEPKKQIFSFNTTVAIDASIDLPFKAQSIRFDNFTSQWVFIPQLRRWIPPLWYGTVLNVTGLASVYLLFQSPPGIAQPAPVAGGFFLGIAHLEYIPEVDGESIATGSGAVTATITAPLGRQNDAVSISTALSNEDILTLGINDAGNRKIVVGAVADGAAAAGINPIIVSGVDSGGNNQAMLSTIAGSPRVSVASGVATGDASSAQGLLSSTDTNIVGGIASHLFNGTNWDRERNNTSNIVLASAARTATVSIDITNHNARSFVVFLNITVAPNTASTLTINIREKDSISGNYVNVLSSAAILGSSIFAAVPVTNRYTIALGVTVAANISASEALARTMNVQVVHSNADSWTYSISDELSV
jgi:hypothetical protein